MKEITPDKIAFVLVTHVNRAIPGVPDGTDVCLGILLDDDLHYNYEKTMAMSSSASCEATTNAD